MARLIADKYKEWEAECEARFNQLKANEEELNRIFIEIYGLQDELTPDVEDRDVTVRKADLQREIKSLISYAVGCMFGRYSVDVEGLCYAGGEWDVSKYKTIIPDADNIIPICDDDYFDDDIVGKFVDFVRKVYGEETLEQNLRFVADALGGKGTSREVIRNYFLNDFFADHCSTYSVTGSGKRPIYWLFSSGKKNGFKALIYIINVPKLDFRSLYARVDEVKTAYTGNLMEMALQREAVELLLPLIQQAEILAGKYDIVATNPPYMNKYSARLKAYVTEHYDGFNGDLFSVFMFRNFGFCKQKGYSGFMTPMVWMFIKTYEELRKYIISQKSIASLVQFEYSAYEEATVPICAFVLKNSKETAFGLYFKLSDFRGGMEVQRVKVLDAIKNRACGYYYETEETSFSKIPGYPLAFWLSNTIFESFANERSLKTICQPKVGVQTGDNERFLRLWFEVLQNRFSATANDTYRWVPMNKGGEYHRWYGNQDFVVNWENDGFEIKNFRDNKGKLRSRPQNLEYAFKECISWSMITSGAFSVRYYPETFMANVAGVCCYSSHEQLMYLLAFMNTKIVGLLTKALNPTLNLNAGDVEKIPIIFREQDKPYILHISSECVELSKADWDSFETSWEFKKHPLI